MLTDLRDRRGPAWFFTGQAGCWCCAATAGYAVYFYGASQSNVPYRDTDKYEVDTWTSKTDAPADARSYAAGASVDAIAYIMGGGSLTATLAENISYVQSSDTFTTKTAMSAARMYGYGVGIDSYAYHMAGYNSSFTKTRTAYQYSPSGNSWATKTDMPTPARTEGAAAATGGKGYVFGGADGAAAIADNDEYDPSGDSWASKTDMPSPARLGHIGWTIDGIVYSCTGVNLGTYYRTVDYYTPGSDTWSSGPNISGTARRNGAGTAPGGTSPGYVSGGLQSSGTLLSAHESYTPSTWTARTAMPSPLRQRMSCAESL